jgi:simple sugar transport system permease protein
MWVLLNRTAWGFEIKAVGQNARASKLAGIPVERRQIQAMAMAGLLAGGVALSEVLGHSGQFKLGFSPDYGFIGIAVALLAFNNPLAVVLSAFLMAALHKGASDLDVETDTITRDFSKVIQALIILGVGIRGWRAYGKKRKNG